MSDSAYHYPSSEETSTEEDQTPDEVPQFGALDIVEAFTAMRHEWRGQTKESRELAEQIQAATAKLGDLEAKLLAQVAESSTDEARTLAKLVADTDHQLTRAVQAVEQAEKNRRLREAADASALERYF